MMSDLNRRQLFRMAALAAGGLAAGSAGAGCDTASPGDGPRDGAALRWWDQFEPISTFEEELFAEFARQPGGMRVDYTVYNPEKMGESLQLAWSSKQMPDVFTLVNVGIPASGLHKGWFAPVELADDHRAMLPDEALINGKSVFDGRPYSFPILSERKHDSLTWFNADCSTRPGLIRRTHRPPTTNSGPRHGRFKQKGGDNVYG